MIRSRRIWRIAGLALGGALLLLVGGGIWGYARLRGSLPALDGPVRLPGLTGAVRVDRDALGIPTIVGASREDVARATGFVHAQDRFFQMDLLRRRAAGELAELVGKAALTRDRQARRHRFRARAGELVAGLQGPPRRVMEAYTAGVNAGLTALGAPPFEYTLLRARPVRWQIEDSVLCLLAMFVQLEDVEGARESAQGVLRDTLPAPLASFLDPPGTEWDAPLAGAAFATPAIPGPEVYDLRQAGPAPGSRGPAPAAAALDAPGSNSWVVDGRRTADGRALLANDIHLPLSVPNTWYRLSLAVGGGQAGGTWRLNGLSLPGLPAILAGSNGRVAWGLTIARADVLDLVVVAPDPRDPSRYLTADGPRPFDRHQERIRVKGGADEVLEVRSTIWGPVLDRDHRGRQRALLWSADQPGGFDLGLLALETATTVPDQLAAANRSGGPPLNFVCADDEGRIGWTITGRLPRRTGWDGRLPASLVERGHGWLGWLPAEDYPRVVSPESGRIWTANARVVDGPALALLGDGGYVLGARARQIREGLAAIARGGPLDMLRLQLDDRAVFLERWQQLLLRTLSGAATPPGSPRDELRGLVQRWGGRAAIDSVGFRAVRAFRAGVLDRAIAPLTAPCRKADARFDHNHLAQLEGPLWALVSARPRHLLDRRYDDWQSLLAEAAGAVLAELSAGGALADRTWGEANAARIRHPLSLAVPALGRWLDMPAQPLPGDRHMPLVQGPSFGAAARMVVSPGREQDGILHMMGGQSGHPLSRYYRAGHDAWVKGAPTPFLPGPTEHRLSLRP